MGLFRVPNPPQRVSIDMDNVVVSKILGESGDWDIFVLTKKLAAILNSYENADIEDTSRGEEDEDGLRIETSGEEYDTSEETDDLRELRDRIFEWATEAHNLFPGNKAVTDIVFSVRHHMHYETRDCLYNLSEPWAEFLRNNPQGPQLVQNGRWRGTDPLYRVISNSTLFDVLSSNPLGDVERDVED